MQTFIAKLKNLQAENNKQIDKFREDIASDAAHALSWGDAVFQAAARVKVINQMTAAAATGMTTERLTATVMQIMTTKARYPSHSSSQTSNLMDQCELAAYAEILEMLQD